MGKRKRRQSKRRQRVEPTLFDLPMRSETGEPAAVDGARTAQAPGTEPRSTAGQGPSILFDEHPQEDVQGGDPRLDSIELTPRSSGDGVPEGPSAGEPSADRPADDLPDAQPADDPADDPVNGPAGDPVNGPADDPAFLGDRLLGGLADLAAQLLMLGLAIAASHSMGVAVTVADWQPFAVLALVFSFLYWVVPLAFWGQTPGMAWVGHTARSQSGDPLSFGQTFRRWFGSILTLALAGLPLLLALTGRSLTDRVSDSKTVAD